MLIFAQIFALFIGRYECSILLNLKYTCRHWIFYILLVTIESMHVPAFDTTYIVA